MVFPWVLQDYHSRTLDLTDAASFRDLSKPMGALQVFRENEATQRYLTLAQDQEREQAQGQGQGQMCASISPPCHYGVHYSTAGVLLHYLVRLQPFASVAVAFQS